MIPTRGRSREHVSDEKNKKKVEKSKFLHFQQSRLLEDLVDLDLFVGSYAGSSHPQTCCRRPIFSTFFPVTFFNYFCRVLTMASCLMLN